MESAYWRAWASFSLDQPALSGDDAVCHEDAGKVEDAAVWARTSRGPAAGKTARKAQSRKTTGRIVRRGMQRVVPQKSLRTLAQIEGSFPQRNDPIPDQEAEFGLVGGALPGLRNKAG